MWLLLSAASLGLAVVLHGFSSRSFLQLDSVHRFILVGVPIGIVLTIAAFARYDLTVPALAAIALYAFLCELYIFCFTLAISSISATILVMLRRGAIVEENFVRSYSPREMVELRLMRLLQNGLIERIDGRLTVTAKGLKLHGLFTALRRFFGHQSG